jgi:cell division protein FtsQ
MHEGNSAATKPSAQKSSDHARRGGVAGFCRVLVGVLLVGCTSVGIAWTARRYILNNARFALTHVEVVGAERRPEDAIVAASGLVLGTNVFAIDLDAARSRLLADPWIAEAALARRLPGTVSIRVTEHVPVALVALSETFLTTPEGDLFKKIDASDTLDLPVITGIQDEALAEDRERATRSLRRAIELAMEFERSELARRAELQEVHVSPDGEFTLVLGRSATELVLGPPPFRRKLSQAARVLAELERRGGRPTSVMLDSDTRPDRVVVRMR